MVTEKIKQLAEYQEKVDELKKAIDGQLKQELATLHEKYGFETPLALIKAIKQCSGGKRAGRRAAKPAAAGKKRKRAKITPETKEKLKALIAEGDKTGSQIAKLLGISLPSVQNIKKELGLVTPRKK